ncbi:MAG: hypothetical protein ACTS6O_06150 [Giesbergeria sp.]
MREASLAQITIELLPVGRVRLSSTCMGLPDSSYMPLLQDRSPAEVSKLIAELRERLEGFTSV